MRSELWEKLTALWCNTTLGLMVFWWLGTRQQQGRAILSISRHGELLSLDPQQLNAQQLQLTEEIFDNFVNKELKPANEAYQDKTREELDRAMLLDLLELPEEIMEPLKLLRLQWCNEPSVHGGKSSRPN